jgi:hypothetical protein
MLEKLSLDEPDTQLGTKTPASAIGKLTERFSRLDNPRTLCLLVFLFSVLVMIGYKPFSQVVEGDSAIYDYMSQSILRGQIPYRDIADIKFPGTVYLNALAIWIGEWVGLKDIFAIRLLQIVELGLLSVFTFLVAEIYLKSRAAGLIAVLIPLLNKYYAGWVVMGSQPKLPLMMFGMLTLLLIAKDKPFWAGLCSMMACLCWQPGLMFTGTAGLVFSNYLMSWRDGRVVKVILGAAVPLTLLFGYFYLAGAFGDLWAWTVTYNYSVFAPDAQKSFLEGVEHIGVVTRRIFERESLFAIFSIVGYVIFVGERFRARWKGKERSFASGGFRDALIFPFLVYFLFCTINMQGGPDLIPFIPFFGIFGSYFIVKLTRLVAKRKPLDSSLPQAEKLIIGLAIFLLLVTVSFRAARFQTGSRNLQDQYRQLQPIAEVLSESDKLYIHGNAAILVLLKKPNINPYIFLDWGADEFAASRTPGGFAAIIDGMEAQAPKIVSITRLKKVAYKNDFSDWVDAHYDEFIKFDGDPVYIRR